MGVVLTGCRSSCSWASIGISIAALDGNTYIRGVHTTFTFRFSWTNLSFPFAPCPDPQKATLYYRKYNHDTNSWSAWKKIAGSISTCGPDAISAVVRCTGTVSFNMSSGVNYFRELFFCEKGTFQILCDTKCTGGGTEQVRSRVKRVVVV